MLPLMDVTFPEGTKIRASSIFDRVEHDSQRSFGLYLDREWRPTWPADMIDWPDFGLPADPEQAARQIEAAYARATRGEVVEIGCLGGLGRTGTVLACMAVLAGVPSSEAVAWVRSAYNVAAVETSAQAEWVQWFADRTRRVSP
jgi:rhodanese/phosphatase family protein